MSEASLQGKAVLVVGLARSGVAAANFLAARGAQVTVNDRGTAAELSEGLSGLDAGVRCELGRHPLQLFLGAQLIVVSPGVPADLEPLQQACRAGIPVWAEVELAGRFLESPIIGVTGSNGKTTTATLIGELFRAAGAACEVAGNIGRPLIEVAAGGPSPATTAVVELSSFQLETVDTFRPAIALLLNLTPDHLDRHGSMEAYCRAKERIFMNQSAADHAVLNLDDARVAACRDRVEAGVFGFSRSDRAEAFCCVSGGRIVIRPPGGQREVCAVDELGLKGAHNLENTLAAVAAGALSGLPEAAMAEACRSFTGVPHRLERVATVGGVTFYNDSKATNSDAAVKALEAFDEELVVIMGGLAKGGGFRSLRPAVAAKARRLVLLGKAADRLEADLGDLAGVSRVDSLEEAVEIAFEAAAPAGVVLLAPACASFDMFDNFEQRGDAFKELVRKLAVREEAS